MPEILTESFCERCGTRYTFESAAPRAKPLRGLKTLGRGLKNFVLSDDTSIDEAMAAARSEAERDVTTQQLDAFHSTFNFCMSCRQYTCANCWNTAEGQCLTCSPHLGREIMPAPFPTLEASLHPVAEHGNGVPIANPFDAPAAWPMPVGGAEADTVADPADAERIEEIDLGARLQALDLDERAAAADEPIEPPVAGPAAALDDAAAAEPRAPAIAGLEPNQSLDAALEAFERQYDADAAAAVQEEPALGTVGAEPEPVAAEQDPVSADPEPFAAEPEPVATELEPVAETAELDAAELEPELEPEPVAAAAQAELGDPEPEPVAAEPEPVAAAAEPVAAEPEPMIDLEAEPVPAAPEPVVAEPEPVAGVQDRIEQPVWLPVAPDPGGQPAATPDDAGIAAAASAAPETTRSQPQWPSQPEWPALRSTTPRPDKILGRPTVPSGGIDALWAASSEEVVAAPLGRGPAPAGQPLPVAAQPCVNCGLSLSASARFCRRCGTAQASV